MSVPVSTALDFASVFDHARLGMVISDDAGRIVRVNDAFVRIVGREADELIGRDSTAFTHPDDVGLRAIGLQRGTTSFEKRYIRPDGAIVWVRVHLAPAYRNESGQCYIGTIEDITEQRELREELIVTRRRVSSALIAGEIGTYEWDVTSDRLWGDANFDRIFGVQRDADGTAPLARFVEAIHPDDRAHVMEAVTATVNRSVDYETEYRVINAGVELWVSARGRLAAPDERGVIRFHGVVLDITARKRAEQELRRRTRLYDRLALEAERAARAEVERGSRMKDEFLATLSHELRTPLAAVLGWAQILGAGGNTPEEVEEGIAVIGRNARAQAQIIDDLLEMSRIVSGKIRLEVQQLQLGGVVRAAVATVQSAADAKRVRVSIAEEDAALRISGDENRLQQVFWNLLSNAVKFTPSEGRIDVRVARVDSHVEVSVCDTGAGIRPEFLPFVFDRFRQADASTTRLHGGLGLGLAIVKQLVELHGGTVRVASEGLEKGATFTVTLPIVALRQSEEPETRRRTREERRPVASDCGGVDGLRVLVVDDDDDARVIVRRFLEDCNAVVTPAASAAEALAHLEAGRFDVLLSDIGMPGEDGYTLIRKVRAAGHAIPAVALTAYARPDDRVRATEAGFQAHLPKPADPAELVAVVAEVAGRV
jgi:PAS domain S-box-containing protein